MSNCQKCGRTYAGHLKARPGHAFVGFVTWAEIDGATARVEAQLAAEEPLRR